MNRAPLFRYPVKSTDVPVTQTMLFHVRGELKAEISALRSELKSDINSLSHKMTSEFHRLGLLIEEQNARNVFVLDGLRVLFDRQDRIEKQWAKANP